MGIRMGLWTLKAIVGMPCTPEPLSSPKSWKEGVWGGPSIGPARRGAEGGEMRPWFSVCTLRVLSYALLSCGLEIVEYACLISEIFVSITLIKVQK